MKIESGKEIKPGSLQEIAMRARENDRSYGREVMQEFLDQQRSQMMEEHMRWWRNI